LKAAFEASRVEGGIFLKRKCGGGEETMMKYLGSISPMLYEQFLSPQIPKAQKNTIKLSVFFMRFGSLHIKAVYKMLVKLSPQAQLERGRCCCRRWGQCSH